MDILADVDPAKGMPEAAALNNAASMATAAEADPVLQSVIAAEAPRVPPILPGADFSGAADGSGFVGFVESEFNQATWAVADSHTLLFLQPEQNHQLEREQFRSLRSRLYQIRANQPIKTILVSSARPAEGKTFVSANLAMAMARQHGRRILLIDADLRKPGLCQVLGAPACPGLAEYLKGEADIVSVVQKAPTSDLYFLPAGRSVPNPGELIGNGRLAKLIESAGTIFDWIILDSPPAVPITDASLIVEACDGVVLVLKASSTPFDVAQKACSEFRRKPVLGVVLNYAEGSGAHGAYYYNYYGKKSSHHQPKIENS